MAVGRLMNFRVILGIRLGVGAFRSSVRAPAHVPFLPTPPPSWTRNPINAFYFLHTNSVKDFCAQDDAKLVRGKKNYKGTLSTRSLEAQAAYGAVILSFLGGPHWGLAMVRTHAPPHDKVFSINISTFRFIWSIVPSLLAWPALLLSDIPKMCLLIFSFALVLGVDAWFSIQGILPLWFLPLRALLTLIVILCLLSSTLQAYFKIKEKSRREVIEG
ncbi:uncharacterized protein LOC131065051 isoform X3 [Cryptomeria japonica]|uniref:uncharacterized protein LOC131065051 isoform X3 n=1 Tax=Cryptomeria japonica TaxID=3369 RepID=UPI0027D9F9C1|nr:uncharacterized protein LOC131065051 isoform X3 [Cryptomeria japonica]